MMELNSSKWKWLLWIFSLFLSFYCLKTMTSIISDIIRNLDFHGLSLKHAHKKVADALAHNVEAHTHRSLFRQFGLKIRNTLFQIPVVQTFFLTVPSNKLAAKMGFDVLIVMECGVLWLRFSKNLTASVCTSSHRLTKRAAQTVHQFLPRHAYTVRGWLTLLVTTFFLLVVTFLSLSAALLFVAYSPVLSIILYSHQAYLRLVVLLEELPPPSFFTNYLKRVPLSVILIVISPTIVYQLIRLRLKTGNNATWIAFWAYGIWRTVL